MMRRRIGTGFSSQILVHLVEVPSEFCTGFNQYLAPTSLYNRRWQLYVSDTHKVEDLGELILQNGRVPG